MQERIKRGATKGIKLSIQSLKNTLSLAFDHSNIKYTYDQRLVAIHLSCIILLISDYTIV